MVHVFFELHFLSPFLDHRYYQHGGEIDQKPPSFRLFKMTIDFPETLLLLLKDFLSAPPSSVTPQKGGM